MKIAFVSADLSSKFSRELWTGIQNSCKQNKIDCINYTGSLIHGADSNKTGVYIYDMIKKSNVDGVIVYGGDISQFKTKEETHEFINSFAPIPTVSVAFETEGCINLCADNYEGMYALVEHMVYHHGYRSLAFIKGPDGHYEADERLKAFNDVCEKYNVENAEITLLSGSFSPESGIKAVKTLFESMKPLPRCIICADDDTALGVHSELTKRGISIPKQVAIGGFDDSVGSYTISPPLTTVSQPLIEQGQQAVEILQQVFYGHDVEKNQISKSPLICRQSCGCNKITLASFRDLKRSEKPESQLPTLNIFLEEISPAKISNKHLCNTMETSQLVNQLYHTLLEEDESYFLSKIESITNRVLKENSFAYPLNTLLTDIYDKTVPLLTKDKRVFTNKLFHVAREVVSSLSERYKASQHAEAQEKLEEFGSFTLRINSSFSPSEFGDVIKNLSEEYFSQLGISEFHLCLYSDPKNNLDKAKAFFSWTPDHSVLHPDDIQPHNSWLMLPEHLNSKTEGTFIICSVGFEESHYGYTLTEIPSEYAQIAEMISWQIGSALLRSHLMEESRVKNSELEESLDRLKQAQQQLIESEKMASLGNLVAGVAHEINTPVGLGVTYGSMLKEQVSIFKELFLSGKLKKSDFESFMNKTNEISDGICFNMSRAAELIRSFKDIAVDQTSEIERKIVLNEYLLEVINSLQGATKKRGVTVNLNCDKDISLTTYPGALSQILTNLINNSVIHAFEPGQTGTLKIAVETDETTLTINYCDNGKGMTDEVREKVFEPFFTTKRGSGGTGLGMHVIYNIVTQKLKGKISCKSELGHGTCFQIKLPIKRYS